MNFNFKIFKKKIAIKYSRLSTTSKNILDFIRFILEYGILLSIVAYGIFRTDIDITRMLGLGILYYFIMYEVPIIYRYWKEWRGA